MRIEEMAYDKTYPFVIKDSWGGEVYCDKEDLEEIKKKIEKILDKTVQV